MPVTNRLGGFANGTITLSNTRHCHAPVGRRTASIAVMALLRKASREVPMAYSSLVKLRSPASHQGT
jgi:hypothetical protein